MATGCPSTQLFRPDCRAAGVRDRIRKSAQSAWGRGLEMIDRTLIVKLLCVAAVAAVMLPVGHVLFPYVSHVLSGMQFQAIEAVLSATVGFGLSAVVG